MKSFKGNLDQFLEHCQKMNADEYLEFFNRVNARENDIITTLVKGGIPTQYAKMYARVVQRLIDDGLLDIKHDVAQNEYYDLSENGKKLASSFKDLIDREIENYEHIIQSQLDAEAVNPS